MSFSFRPAKRENVPLLIGLAGGTGSGKTFSALRLARGIAGGEPFAYADTENGRANLYADHFPEMQHANIEPPFRPEKYTEAIEAADAKSFPVIVVDSMSHEWYGDGGCLAWHDELTGGNQKKSPSAWAKVKPAHTRMVMRLLRVKAHVILCFRAAEKVDIITEDGEIKFVPKKTLTGLDGWVPISERNLPFEMTASFLLMADAPGVPRAIKLPGDLRPLVPLDEPMTEETGQRLADWARGSAGRTDSQADGAARRGAAAADASSPPAEQPATTPEPAAPEQDFEGEEPPPASDPVELAGAITFDHPNSRHNGKTVAWVADNDPDYLPWYLETGKNERLKAAITTYLHTRKPELVA